MLGQVAGFWHHVSSQKKRGYIPILLLILPKNGRRAGRCFWRPQLWRVVIGPRNNGLMRRWPRAIWVLVLLPEGTHPLVGTQKEKSVSTTWTTLLCLGWTNRILSYAALSEITLWLTTWHRNCFNTSIAGCFKGNRCLWLNPRASLGFCALQMFCSNPTADGSPGRNTVAHVHRGADFLGAWSSLLQSPRVHLLVKTVAVASGFGFLLPWDSWKSTKIHKIIETFQNDPLILP